MNLNAITPTGEWLYEGDPDPAYRDDEELDPETEPEYESESDISENSLILDSYPFNRERLESGESPIWAFESN